MSVRSARVEAVVALVQELTPEELGELADYLGALVAASDSRSRVAAAIRRVVESHQEVPRGPRQIAQRRVAVCRGH